MTEDRTSNTDSYEVRGQIEFVIALPEYPGCFNIQNDIRIVQGSCHAKHENQYALTMKVVVVKQPFACLGETAVAIAIDSILVAISIDSILPVAIAIRSSSNSS